MIRKHVRCWDGNDDDEENMKRYKFENLENFDDFKTLIDSQID